jgi:hypothetical protein
MDVPFQTKKNKMRKSLPFPPGSLVRVTKFSASEDSITEPGTWKQWVPGSPNNAGSLPVGYDLRGVLMQPIRLGGCLEVYRTHRNGVSAHGNFRSTPIIGIVADTMVETFNSIYLIAKLNVPNLDEEEG